MLVSALLWTKIYLLILWILSHTLAFNKVNAACIHLLCVKKVFTVNCIFAFLLFYVWFWKCGPFSLWVLDLLILLWKSKGRWALWKLLFNLGCWIIFSSVQRLSIGCPDSLMFTINVSDKWLSVVFFVCYKLMSLKNYCLVFFFNQINIAYFHRKI